MCVWCSVVVLLTSAVTRARAFVNIVCLCIVGGLQGMGIDTCLYGHCEGMAG